MITASATMKGTLHEEKGIANQDAVCLVEKAGYSCAILGDGVSLKSDWTFSNSEIASAIVTRSAAMYLEEMLKTSLDDQQAMDLVRDTFQFAEQMLGESLEKAGIPFLDCQTTLIVALFKEGRLYGGIAGDGGILYEQKDGSIGLMVTHLKTSSSVFPIGDTHQWRFFEAGSTGQPVIQVLAATDGVFDQLIIPYNGQPVGNFEEISRLFQIGSIPENQRHDWLEKQIAALPGYDDKTIALLIDPEKRKEQDIQNQEGGRYTPESQDADPD